MLRLQFKKLNTEWELVWKKHAGRLITALSSGKYFYRVQL